MSLLYIKQQVRNDKAVVEALKGLEQKSFRNAKRVVVQDVDYNILTFEEQILTDLNTDVMIGPHGAGMSLFWYCVGTVCVIFIQGTYLVAVLVASCYNANCDGVSLLHCLLSPL